MTRTYQETLEYLYNKLPMFTRIGAAAYKPNLDNTIALCEALDNPQNKFKSIHIAGTNGKGSSSHMLASILQQSGYKTALYTSPHLFNFNERIKINGQPIEEQFVIDFISKIDYLLNSLQPSFFEITVAMAFSYFAEQQVNIAVIETGLGGLLDSTNVISPELCLITNIGYDHVNLLGNTLQEIALQKAGIIKQNTPVVISETQDDIKPIFNNKALLLQAPIIYANTIYDVVKTNATNSTQQVKIINKGNLTITSYTIDLLGTYQLKNIKGIIAATTILYELGWKNIGTTSIEKGLANIIKNTGLRGRFEIINQSPIAIIDVAHNAEGLTEVIAQATNISTGNLHIIIGMVNDKEITKALQVLPTLATYYFTQAHIPRALPAKDLQEQASNFKLNGLVYNNVNVAYKSALSNAAANDTILICGSFFVIAELEL